MAPVECGYPVATPALDRAYHGITRCGHDSFSAAPRKDKPTSHLAVGNFLVNVKKIPPASRFRCLGDMGNDDGNLIGLASRTSSLFSGLLTALAVRFWALRD